MKSSSSTSATWWPASPRPVKELAGFERVTLQPGEKRTARFELGPDRLGFYDRELQFVVEPGEFQVFVGTSSVGGLEERFDVLDASVPER